MPVDGPVGRYTYRDRRNRKVLADLALREPAALDALAKPAIETLGKDGGER